eukprot:gene15107-20326_t
MKKDKICVVLFFILIQISFSSYPSTSLKCYSYLTKPKHQLICPAARNNYCVKETSDLTQDLCGATQYFGDIYVKGKCTFKKCSNVCVPKTYQFQYQGVDYSRRTYCCNTDYCNSGFGLGNRSPISLLLFCL